MKRYTRLLALVLVAAALLMTGCGDRIGRTDKEEKQLSDPVTVSSLVEVMMEQLWKQQSMKWHVGGGIDMAADSGNGMMDVKLDVDVQGELVTDPIQLHLNGTGEMNMMGMNMALPVEAYLLQDSDTFRLIFGIMGKWMTQDIPMESDQMAQMLDNVPEFTLNEEALAHIHLNEEKEAIEGKECYRLDLVLSQDELNQLTEAFVQGVSEGSSQRAQMGDSSALDVGMTLWIDAQTILPTRFSVNLNGTVETESFVLRGIDLQLDLSDYNTVEEIVVPDEVVNNAEPADIASSLPL